MDKTSICSVGAIWRTDTIIVNKLISNLVNNVIVVFSEIHRQIISQWSEETTESRIGNSNLTMVPEK